MTFKEAKALLEQCVRFELRDHAFGDAEICWMRDGLEVGFAYVGAVPSMVSVTPEGPPEVSDKRPSFTFTGRESRELLRCGRLEVERNDSTGPEHFEAGRCMPGLTIAGVRKELCGE